MALIFFVLLHMFTCVVSRESQQRDSHMRVTLSTLCSFLSRIRRINPRFTYIHLSRLICKSKRVARLHNLMIMLSGSSTSMRFSTSSSNAKYVYHARTYAYIHLCARHVIQSESAVVPRRSLPVRWISWRSTRTPGPVNRDNSDNADRKYARK